MKKPAIFLVWGIAGLLVAAAAGYGILRYRFLPDEKGRVVPWGERIDIAVLPEIRASLASLRSMEIFEGLPSGGGLDDEFRKAEIAAGKSFKLHGYRFYKTPRSPSPDELRTLADALAREDGIVEWIGAKFCGGYHPDFAIRWHDANGDAFDALICLGCHEIKFYGPRLRLYADLETDTYNILRKTLRPDPPAPDHAERENH